MKLEISSVKGEVRKMRRLVAIIVLIVCLAATTLSFAAGQFQGCRVLYYDDQKQRYILLDPATASEQVVETGSVPYSGNNDVAPYVLSYDHRLLAVSMGDTGVETWGVTDRMGAKVYDVSGDTPVLYDTIPLYFPVESFHHSNKLVLRSALDVDGAYAIYDLKSKSFVDFRQATAPIPGSPYTNGRDAIRLSVWDVALSPDDLYVYLWGDEHPFPQDDDGENMGIYIAPIGDMAIRLSDRKVDGTDEFLGWLPDNRLMYRTCSDDSCQWIAATPDGKHKETLFEKLDATTFFLNPAPVGTKLAIMTDIVSNEGVFRSGKLSVYDMETKKTQFIASVSGLYSDYLGTRDYLKWSPDGRFLLYSTVLNDKTRVVSVNVTSLKSDVLGIEPGEVMGLGEWSPDGKLLLLDSAVGDLKDHFTIYNFGTKAVSNIPFPEPYDQDTHAGMSWVCNR